METLALEQPQERVNKTLQQAVLPLLPGCLAHVFGRAPIAPGGPTATILSLISLPPTEDRGAGPVTVLLGLEV